MTAEEILYRLKDGNERFVTDRLEKKLQNSERREALIEGQKPIAVILGCSDSRVVPEIAFDTGLGELFVVRVAGNVANTSSIASIEYAVAQLGTKLIVVLGHQSCGAVNAAVAGGNRGNNLNHLLSHITPSLRTLNRDASVNDVAKENARLTVKELGKRSELIREAIEEGSVSAVPAYYNLDTGKVDFL